MYNQNFTQSNQPNLKTLLIIHIALLIGQLMFAMVCLSITPNKGFSFNTQEPFNWVAIVLTVGGFALSAFLYRMQLSAALKRVSAKEKLLNYTTAIIMRAAPLEAASMFCIVAYILTGNTFFMGIAAIIILYFIVVIPTKDRVLTSLNLSAADLTNDSTANY
jgi:divalent metal cation (Fe/Co/Zn/Cd) transporter